MDQKPKLSFDYLSSQRPFYNDVMKTIIQQPDYIGIGGHDLLNHGKHGSHYQTSIGIVNSTINFRELKYNK